MEGSLIPRERDPILRGGLSAYYDKYDARLNPSYLRRPALPALDARARSTKALKKKCMAEDRDYRRFLLMLEHGVPLAAVWDKVIASGLDPSKLLNDPEGPAEHQPLRDPNKEQEACEDIFIKRMEVAPWRAHAVDWSGMQRHASLNLRDEPLFPRGVGLAQQQRLEEHRQDGWEEHRRARAAPGHQSFVPLKQGINKVTADERKVRRMRRNFPHLYSSQVAVYKSTRGTGIGVPAGVDLFGFNHDAPNHAEREFWRQNDRGRVRDLVPCWGATSGSGGFSLAVDSRVPITWKSHKEIESTWRTKIQQG